MKKLFMLFSVMIALLLVGCNTVKPNQQPEKGDFKFCSVEWGSDWETLRESDAFRNAVILKENGNRKTLEPEDGTYLGIPVEEAGLVFDSNGVGDIAGLTSVAIRYEEEYEEAFLSKLEELYGKRENTYKDKNGYTNPIDPAGWVSNETVESVLTEEEKEYYVSMFPKDYGQTRIDALLRSPLVTINFDDENNIVVFNGNDAATVSYIQRELRL